MSDYERRAKALAQSIDIELTLTDGSPALDLHAADVSVAYHQLGSSLILLPLVDLAAHNDAWVEGGFVALNPQFAAGVYRVDLPDGFWYSMPDITVVFSGAGLTQRTIIIGVQPWPVFAEIRMVNGVPINGSGVEGDEFQP